MIFNNNVNTHGFSKPTQPGETLNRLIDPPLGIVFSREIYSYRVTANLSSQLNPLFVLFDRSLDYFIGGISKISLFINHDQNVRNTIVFSSGMKCFGQTTYVLAGGSSIFKLVKIKLINILDSDKTHISCINSKVVNIFFS